MAASAFGVSCSKKTEDARLTFLNWPDYIDGKTLGDFEQTTQVKVTYQNYYSNDELLWLLSQASTHRSAAGSGYDLCVPSENAMMTLRRNDRLQDFEKGKIVGLENLMPSMLKRISDPVNAFSVPWATGTTGIAWDSRVLTQEPDWDIFLDSKLAGKMSLHDESVDGLMVGLMASGIAADKNDAANLQTAVTTLKKMRKNAKLNSKTYLNELIGGQTSVAMAYSNDFVQAKEKNPHLKFVIPKSGGIQWTDCMVIPLKAPRPQRAHEFINFVLRPEISAQIANGARVNTGNAAALSMLSAELRENTVVFPSDTDLARAHPLPFHDEEALRRINSAWREVKRGA
jgi:spermidine/putrescine transport system substrate-binding protein